MRHSHGSQVQQQALRSKNIQGRVEATEGAAKEEPRMSAQATSEIQTRKAQRFGEKEAQIPSCSTRRWLPVTLTIDPTR